MNYKSHPSLYLELFVQMCPAAVSWCRDAVEVAVKLAGCHFCLLPQNGFHQGIVDENVLLLDQPKGDKRQLWQISTDGLTYTHTYKCRILYLA